MADASDGRALADDRAMWAPRSLLFVPGSRTELVLKATASGADGVIVDLEDAVAPERRPEARSAIVDVLAQPSPVPLVVRVNPATTDDMELDLQAVVRPGLAAVILPKADTPADIQALVEALTRLEAEADLPVGWISVIPLVESCKGIHFSFEIAGASPRVRAMAFSSGEQGDYMADLGGRWTPTGEALHYARSKMLGESRAAGVEVVLDGVFMNLDDTDALRREAELARTLGYSGKLAIHPKQVPVLHDVFTPSDEEIRQSREVLSAFEAAKSEGTGAFRLGGMMIDEANAKVARRTLALAARLGDAR